MSLGDIMCLKRWQVPNHFNTVLEPGLAFLGLGLEQPLRHYPFPLPSCPSSPLSFPPLFSLPSLPLSYSATNYSLAPSCGGQTLRHPDTFSGQSWPRSWVTCSQAHLQLFPHFHLHSLLNLLPGLSQVEAK